MAKNQQFFFTFENYRFILEKLKSNNYEFLTFPEAKKTLKNRSKNARPFTILRHDIHFDLEAVRKIMSIENDMNVSATYFLTLRSPAYNIFSPETQSLISTLKEHDHRLGLHFDTHYYADEAGWDELKKACQSEIQTLETGIDDPVDSVSLHKPGNKFRNLENALPNEITSAYDSLFTEEIHYLSDSRREWPCEDLQSRVLGNNNSLQLLTHPEWWANSDCSDPHLLETFLKRKKESIEHYLIKEFQNLEN